MFDELREQRINEGYMLLAEEILEGIHERMKNALEFPSDPVIEELLEDMKDLDFLTMRNGDILRETFYNDLVRIGYWPASAV